MDDNKQTVGQPIFRHLDDDDVQFMNVRAQRNADGTVSHVREKWLAIGQDTPYLSLYAEYDPGMIVRRHGHHCNHVVFVLAGSARFGDRECPAGTHIELPEGAAFGPCVAGPEGVTFFEVMMGDPRSWGDQPELFEQELAAVGAEALPHPELTFPGWLAPLRERFSAPR
jgi:hypothetical protein